jgi:hypothetical protein
VSDWLDRRYFANENAEECYALKYHLDEARAEGLTEVTLMEAVPDFDNPYYIYCTSSGEVGEKRDCSKINCDGYEPRGKSHGGPCKYRGHLYEHGDKKTFKVD